MNNLLFNINATRRAVMKQILLLAFTVILLSPAMRAQETNSSTNELIKDFKDLPGASAFMAAKVSGDTLETLAAYNSGCELAIGSSFKLYILSELLRNINDGTLKWTDIVKLQPEARSLPSGFL
jgi:beta-lactamase class A